MFQCFVVEISLFLISIISAGSDDLIFQLPPLPLFLCVSKVLVLLFLISVISANQWWAFHSLLAEKLPRVDNLYTSKQEKTKCPNTSLSAKSPEREI